MLEIVGDIEMSEDVKIEDVVNVIDNIEEAKWYSMLECEVKIDENTSRRIKMPACFIKQIGLIQSDDIQEVDYMLPGDIATKTKFNDECYFFDKFNKNGLERVKGYWDGILPKELQSIELIEKIYYVLRIAACICVLDVEKKNENIDGIGSFCEYLSEKIKGENDFNWSGYSIKLKLIEDALLDKGKIIGPLSGNYYFTGWRIISMVYSMFWYNSHIHNNVDELRFIAQILSEVKNYTPQFLPNNSFAIGIAKHIEEKIKSQNISGEAWIILFLYIRNLQWCYEYQYEVLSRFNMSDYDSEAFSKLFYLAGYKFDIKDNVIDKVCDGKLTTNDLKDIILGKIKELPRSDFQWLMMMLLGETVSKKKSDQIRQLKNKLEPAIELHKYFWERLKAKYRSIMLESHYPNEGLQWFADVLSNELFWIFVEVIIYRDFIKGEYPSCNNLDFIRKAGLDDTFSRGKEHYSVIHLPKGVKGMANLLSNCMGSDWRNFVQYICVYEETFSIREAILRAEKLERYYVGHIALISLLDTQFKNLLECMTAK